MRGDSEAQARDRLKLFFLLRRLGEHFKIDVSEQEVNGRIATIAAQHGQRPDQLRTELARTGKINEVARMVYEQKAADRVIAKAEIEEIPADKWNEIMAADGNRHVNEEENDEEDHQEDDDEEDDDEEDRQQVIAAA